MSQSAVLITGACGGIGQAMVQVFHEAGYAVIATDIAAPPAGLPCAHFVTADLQRTVEDESYAAVVFAEIRRHLDNRPLRALINNAAVQILGATGQLSRADWRRTLDVNLLAPFIWTQALLPELEAVTACVINIGSIHARLTKKGFVAYATSKAALAGMTRALAVDLGSSIRINAIEPAAIETDMLRAGFAEKPLLYNQLKDCHPQRRIGQADEVARLAVAVTDGGMNFLHGTCISIDGGISGRLFDPC